MTDPLTDAELAAYLDEDLSLSRMGAVEQALRDDEALRERLNQVAGQRDAGVHSLGGIWRRHWLSCPTREQWGSFLLGVLDEAEADYFRFHLDQVGCRACNANLADLRQQAAEDDTAATQTRRHKYFQSSAGFLSSD